MNNDFKTFLIILFISILLILIAFWDMFNTPQFGFQIKETYINNTNSIVYVNFVNPNIYFNIRNMDTILMINNKIFNNIYDLKKNYLYKHKPNDIITLTIKRKNHLFYIPIKLITKKSLLNISFLKIITFLIILSATLFYLTFPFYSPMRFIIFVFYCCLTVLLLLIQGTFEKWYFYSLFIIISSITPFLVLYGSLMLNNIFNKKIFILIISGFIILCFNWLATYLNWAFSFTHSSLNLLSLSVKFSQTITLIVSLISLILIIKFLLYSFHSNHYLFFAILIILISFMPVIFLFIIPVALGKHEIVSLDVNLLFIYTPLLLLLIYNNFLYRKIYENINNNNSFNNGDNITFSGF